MQMTGNTIFITGGTSGIGRALAEQFHSLGNKVIIAGRRQALLDDVAAAHPGIEGVALDISDAADIDRVAAQLIRDYPTLNVLINNAGIMLSTIRRAGSMMPCRARFSTRTCLARSG